MRKPLKEFAEAMEIKLQEHDDDYGEEGWLIGNRCSVRFLYDRLTEELTELRNALNDCNPQEVMLESLDVANFAMMIHSRIKLIQKESGYK